MNNNELIVTRVRGSLTDSEYLFTGLTERSKKKSVERFFLVVEARISLELCLRFYSAISLVRN